MIRLSRRQTLKGAAAVAAGSALAAPAIAQSSLAGTTLRVALFGGGHRDFVHSAVGSKIEAMGAKVEYVAGAPAEHLAKLIAARGRPAPFDVVEMIDAIVPDFIGGNFLQKIDLSAIANRVEMPGFAYDDMKVANWVTQEGLVYNFVKFKELGLDTPQTYSDFANAKLAGKIVFPDVGTGGWVNAMVGVSVEAGGNEGNIDPGLAFVKDRLKPRSFFSGSGETEYTEFKNGDIWGAVMHAGWAIQMRKRGIDHVRAAFPAMGPGKRGQLKLGYFGITRGASPQVQKAAEAFINIMVSAEAQEAMTKARGLVPVNLPAMARLSTDPLLAENLMLKPEQVNNVYQVDFGKVKVPEWTDKWNRMVARR
jgi:putative spermidine/putrescine transport system substrate-binding protein